LNRPDAGKAELKFGPTVGPWIDGRTKVRPYGSAYDSGVGLALTRPN
jgi:hypothetical protein